MSEYDFTGGEELAAEPQSWENLNEGIIKGEIGGLISRLNNVSALVEQMAYKNDYDKTSQEFENLWFNDLSTAGWIQSFLNANKGVMAELRHESVRPGWYPGMSPERQKNFDAALQHYKDLTKLSGILNELQKMMMLFPLKGGFKFQRVTMNFYDADFNEDLYLKINNDMQEVNQLLRTSWDGLERNAYRSQRYYQDKSGKVSMDELVKGYHQARLADYQSIVQAFKSPVSFIARSDGTFTVKPDILAEANVIDKYTREVSTLDGIEDDTKKAMEECTNLLAGINAVYGELKSPTTLTLIDALRTFIRTLNDFAETSLHVFTSFKNRDTEAPYCFVRKLPVFSEMNGAYSFSPITSDPWHDGTSFYSLYQSAVRALSEHCRDFVYNHGRPEILSYRR